MRSSDTNKKNLYNPSVLHETNFLSLINPSLAHIIVALHCQIMGKLGLKDSSRKLVASCAISFVISLYLILHACI